MRPWNDLGRAAVLPVYIAILIGMLKGSLCLETKHNLQLQLYVCVDSGVFAGQTWKSVELIAFRGLELRVLDPPLSELPAMVMSSTWMLQQALPIPGRLLLPKFSLNNLRRANSHKKFQTPGQTSVRALGVGCSVFSVVNNPRGFVSGVRTLLCAASSSFNSAMAGACSDPPPMYRANVGVCLINEKNQVFVAQRLDVPGAWQMPQGGIDEEEDPRAAAFRELREETGVTSAEYLGEVPEWLTYDFPPEVKARLTKFWGTEWNGQAQKWFLFNFTGNETEINLLGDGSENPEFSEWKWVPVEEVIKNAVEFKKPVYERAFKHLIKLMK